MRLVYRDFSDDYDVCALTAEALVVRTPWQLWDLKNSTPAEGTFTEEAIEIVEKALGRIEEEKHTPSRGPTSFLYPHNGNVA